MSDEPGGCETHRQDGSVFCPRLVSQLHIRHMDFLVRSEHANWEQLDSVGVGRRRELDQSVGVCLVVEMDDDRDMSRRILSEETKSHSDHRSDMGKGRGGAEHVVSG